MKMVLHVSANVNVVCSQATSLRGVDVVATVEETVKGALPPFDQGTVGINVMPLGSAEV